MSHNTQDYQWMTRAFALAEKGRGFVHPNPMVGAVLVRQGRVVGEGYHRRFGQPHAEVDAIKSAGSKTRGSTLYVTLEPCAHWGKTPPCVEAIVRAGIKRVVCAMGDPNPLVSGKGFRYLKRHRIALVKGVMEREARTLNRAFVTWIVEKRPFVTLKVASSLDGRQSTITGESKWITGEAARESGHRLRAQADAIAVGLGTVQSDNPELTAHGAGRNPVRVLFDSRLQASPRSRVFRKGAPTWCLATDRAVLRHIDQLKRNGVSVLLCRADKKGQVDIRDALKKLAAQGICHLLVEGGPSLQQSFLQAKVVDDVVWYLAPMIIGQTKSLKSAARLQLTRMQPVGDDWCFRGDLH